MKTAELIEALQKPVFSVCRECGHKAVLPPEINYHCLSAKRPAAMLLHLRFRLRCSICSEQNAEICDDKGHVLAKRPSNASRPATPQRKKSIIRKRRKPVVSSTPQRCEQRHSQRRRPQSPNECTLCGSMIDQERLQALPGANTCVSCASAKGNQKKRIIAEPWGSRDDWKKDSGSSFGRAAKPKF